MREGQRFEGPAVAEIERVIVDPDFVTPERCSSLWLRVLREGVNCALGVGYKLGAEQYAEAQAWLASDEFDAVCDLAGVDPVRARAAVSRLASEGAHVRDGGA